MKNRIKKLLIIAIVCFNLPFGFAAGSEIDYYEGFDDNVVEGLDITWAELDSDYGIAPVYDINNDMCAIKTWVSKTRPIKLNHSLNTTINEGMFYVSFDFKTENGYNDCYLRLLSGDTQFQICGFRNTGNFVGKFGHFLDFSKWTLDSETSVQYEPDQWYSVGVLFDMDSRYSYFYFGEQDSELELIETVQLNDSFNNITDVMLVHSFGDNYPAAMWDNIQIYDVNVNTIEEIETSEGLVFDKAIYEKYVNKVYNEDFEKNVIPDLGFTKWSNQSSTYGVMRYDDNNNYAAKTWVDEKYPLRLTHSFDTPLNKGVYYFSFDWKSTSGYNDCYLRLLSGDKQYQICGFRKDGNFGKFSTFSTWSLNHDTEVSYEPEQWYSVGFVVDFDLRTIYIYLSERNGEMELVEKAYLGDELYSITDMVLVHSYGDYSPVLWDNIQVYQLNAETIDFVAEENNIVFDDTLTYRVVCDLVTDNVGNIFHNADYIDMHVKCYNRSLVYKKYLVSYEALYDGNTVYADNKKLSIEDNIDDVIKVPVDAYGFFEFNVLLDGAEYKTRFSNSRAATDGVVNSKVGATVHLTRVKNKTAAFSILQNGGFGAVRGGDNGWQDVETQKGIYEKSTENEEFYNQAVANSFDVMTILNDSNSLYADEYPTTNPDRVGEVESPPHSDGLVEKFAQYCYETVVMYPQVKYFQMWNEWNNAPTFNLDGITDSESYAKLLKAGYDAVKRGAADRGKEAFVVAMSPTGTKAEWIEDVIKALDGEKCFDIVSVHPYTYEDGGLFKESTYAPEDICLRHKKELGTVVQRLQSVRNVLDKYGYSDVPLWAGEFGFSSFVCGEDKQAQYAVRLLALNDANSLLDKMFWYTLQNHVFVNEKEQSYGMIRYDENELVPYEAKPSYVAMSNYNALMADAKISRKISDGNNGIYAYEFTSRDGDDLYLMWTTGKNKEFTLNVDSKLIKTYDIYGNESVVVTEDGSATFTLSESIIYAKVADSYVCVFQNGKAIKKLSDFSDDEAYAIASVDGYDELDILVAQYQGDFLLEVKLCEYKEVNNIGTIHPEADRIEVFVWDEEIMPVYDNLTIE